MYRKYYLLILSILSLLSVMGQRPMSRELIVSKLDSIKNEADLIYNHCMIYRLTKQKFESTNIDHKNIIIVGVDTIKVSVVNDDNLKIYEANYLNQDSLLLLNEKMFISKLNDNERLFFLLKEKLVKKVEQQDYGINNLDQNIQYVLFPYEEGLKFYIISDSRRKDSILFANNFLFYCDNIGSIKSHKVFHMKKLKVSVNDRLGNPRESFVIKYVRENPLILASDIAIFRLVDRPQELLEFQIYSTINKLSIIYNATENKLSLE